MAGSDATEYVRILFTYDWPKNQTLTVAAPPTMTGSVCMQRFRSFLGLSRRIKNNAMRKKERMRGERKESEGG